MLDIDKLALALVSLALNSDRLVLALVSPALALVSLALNSDRLALALVSLVLPQSCPLVLGLHGAACEAGSDNWFWTNQNHWVWVEQSGF